ncbi:Transcription factor bHLH93 [Heracleum sosnowskyi]|uniref:Transcription factor bHLH93 n=1 Tax=Heracleum sosnowskyi TaxID=360622 RepID=A0AAD8IDN8_9APIA|nr:Transcription factor bHLH93 [Heracleum sosnowskyi]
MEPMPYGSLEELVMAPQSGHKTRFAASDHQYFPSTDWSFESSLNYNDSCLNFATPSIPYSQLMMLTSQVESQATFASPCPSNDKQPYFSTYTPPYQVLDELEPTSGQNVHVGNFSNSDDIVYDFKERFSCSSSSDVRDLSASLELPVFSIGSFEEKRNIRNKVKKVEGQPSKNLMAERRRRKRLNDRLSMLRSVVPRISKMDRTSILGDTIDYMKELLEKIHKLKMNDTQANSNQINSLGNLKELDEITETTTKNSSRFDVKRKERSTEINISCPGKPGMVLSTLNTIETLGLDIQQCVVSCFSDFSLEASCSEEEEHRRFISNEDLRRALSRNAGYGGRCL